MAELPLLRREVGDWPAGVVARRMVSAVRPHGAQFVTLRGFSWIVSPDAGGVLVHLEMQSGTASAGPFAIDETRLSGMIARVVAGPVQQSSTVH